MKFIKHLWLPLLSTALLAGTGCRDRDAGYERAKPVDVDVDVNDDFVKIRDRETSELRARLAQLDDKIAELRARGDQKASELADSLRVRRDAISARLDHAGEETSTRWDGFKKDVTNTFADVEHEIDEAF